MVLSTLPSALPSDWDAWIWNKNYRGSLGQAEKTTLNVDKVYTNDSDIVAVFRKSGRYYVQAFDPATLNESCVTLHVDYIPELQGKTLEAYVTETELVGIRTQRQSPASTESWNGAL